MGVAVFMTLDTAVSVAVIDLNDSATWPNMHPWIRIYFIPILAPVFAVAVLMVEWLRGFFWKTQIKSFRHWLVLGFSYTTFLSFLVFF